MRYEKSTNTVVLTSAELSAFAVKRETANSVASKFSVCDMPAIFSDVPGEFASFVTASGDTEITLCASENTRYAENGGDITVISTKKVRKIPDRITPTCDRAFFARASVDAYVVGTAAGVHSVRIVMAFEKDNETVCCGSELEREFLEKTVSSLLSRAAPAVSLACDRGLFCRDELRALKFPYGSVREGQRDLMTETMRVIRTGKKLLACAPTGIGKTVSVLYPALKSIGAGLADKIFYLTAKGITGKTASDLLSRISGNAPHLRSITLGSKEKLCPTRGFSDGCYGCPLASDLTEGNMVLPVEYRLACAAAEVSSRSPLSEKGVLADTAEKYRVCPHELSLKVSEFCDVVICDYNYVFDGRIKLRRYFCDRGNPDGERFVFLIDEAHNVPVRVRDTYSRSIKPSDFGEIFDLIKAHAVDDTSLEDALGSVFEAFTGILGACGDSSSLRETENGEKLVGYTSLAEPPAALVSSLLKIKKAIMPYVQRGNEFRDTFKRTLMAVSDFLFCADAADGKFRFLAEREDSDLTCSVICLDPSTIISDSIRPAHATVMFSATLSPKEYFTEQTGFRGEDYLELDSPFEPDRLSVMICDSVSTRLSDRKKTAADVAELIAATVEEMPGKYLVFFPSFEYLNTVLKEFLKRDCPIPVVAQKSEMTAPERAKFLSLFSSDKYSSLLGFSVLGGMFSEGIDLSGESLIGVIVVGTGLTGISSSLNMISDYYEDKYEKGYEFAYLYPAVNRIQQAVGRVIRSEDDRGIALLIDSRLGDPAVASLFPTCWRPVKLVSDPDSLAACIREFLKR